MGSPALPLPIPTGAPQGPGRLPTPSGPPTYPGPASPFKGPVGPAPQQPAPGTPGTAPQTPAVCTGIPSMQIGCARLLGTVGPPSSTIPGALPNGKAGPPQNNPADVLLVQKLINVVVNSHYVADAVLMDGKSKLVQPLNENGQWSTQLFNAIKQIEVLYFHGRANPHGIGVIDPQADESLFVFLVNLANGSQTAKEQLSVQMEVLALAMVPGGKVLIDAGGTGPGGKPVAKKESAIDVYLPILLDALTARGLNDTDMVLIAIACAYTETSSFVPPTEGMYDLNTSGTFTNNTTRATWDSTPGNVHGANYKTLLSHYTAARKYNPNVLTSGTETWTPNTSGPNGATNQGDIYDAYYDGKRVNHLGNDHAGDGWKYRGRGLIQLTGKALYEEADRKANVGDLFVNDPDQVNSTQYAGKVVAGFLSAVENTIRTAMKTDALARVRKAVNGGTNGLSPFRTAMAAGRAVIADAIIHQAKAATRRKRTHHRHPHSHPGKKK